MCYSCENIPYTVVTSFPGKDSFPVRMLSCMDNHPGFTSIGMFIVMSDYRQCFYVTGLFRGSSSDLSPPPLFSLSPSPTAMLRGCGSARRLYLPLDGTTLFSSLTSHSLTTPHLLHFRHSSAMSS